MVFSIQHTFKKVSETTADDICSPFVHHGPTCWKLCILTEKTDLDEEFRMFLFGLPQHEVQNGTLFEIKVNYKVVITSHVEGKADYIFKAQEARFYKEKVGERTYTGSWLYSIPLEKIKEEDFYLLKDDEMTVSVELDVVTIKGINSFPSYDFHKEFKNSDVILRFPGAFFDSIFNLHSQILYLHSEYFKELLQKESEDDMKVEQVPVVQKAGRKELVLKLEDKFNPYLIRTYFSILYSSGHNLINEFNVREILKLNSHLKSDIILAHVDMFFVSNLDQLEIPIEEIIVLAWKYDLHSLKLIVLKKMTSIDLFKKISKMEDYQSMDEAIRLDLTEQIVFNEIIKK